MIGRMRRDSPVGAAGASCDDAPPAGLYSITSRTDTRSSGIRSSSVSVLCNAAVLGFRVEPPAPAGGRRLIAQKGGRVSLLPPADPAPLPPPPSRLHGRQVSPASCRGHAQGVRRQSIRTRRPDARRAGERAADDSAAPPRCRCSLLRTSSLNRSNRGARAADRVISTTH